MATQTQEREFTGFGPGTRAREIFPDGTYRAELVSIHTIDTQYGPSHKLRYTIISGQDRVTVSELASPSLGTESKFMKRIAAVNGLAKMPKDADLSQFQLSGPVLVTIARNDDSGYLDVVQVSALPVDADTGEVPF